MRAIEARELTKAFGPVDALQGVTLDVGQGECLVIFGPNGAGKTTLLKIFATLMRPTSGTLRLFGSDPRQDESTRRLIGVVSHHSYLYSDLTAVENLAFAARIYAVPDARDRVDALIDAAGLWDRRNDLVRTYSRGMVQRLAIARALTHDPRLLLLDEPYTGLDRQATRAFTGLLNQLRAGRTIVVTTHSIEQGLALADRMVILVDGAIAYESRDGLGDYQAVERIYADCVGVDGWVVHS